MAIKPWKSSEPIGYIERDVPKLDLPPYEGERYERMVPDTLDVAERARPTRFISSPTSWTQTRTTKYISRSLSTAIRQLCGTT